MMASSARFLRLVRASRLRPAESLFNCWQSRSPLARAPSARFYSSKQPTLKERLSELIPIEIENVSLSFLVVGVSEVDL